MAIDPPTEPARTTRQAAPPRRPRGERTLTASEAASLIGVSIATVRGWADAGLLPSHRTVGGHRRFDPSELKDWLRKRGANAARRGRRPQATVAIPPCPALARHLNQRIDGVVARVLDRYHPDVPTPARDQDVALARATGRFVRAITGALEVGSPQVFAGRIELVGVRASLEPEGPGAAVAQHARLVAALAAEADALVAEGADVEPEGEACLFAVIDHAGVALTRGLDAGTPASRARAAD